MAFAQTSKKKKELGKNEEMIPFCYYQERT